MIEFPFIVPKTPRQSHALGNVKVHNSAETPQETSLQACTKAPHAMQLPATNSYGA